MLDYGDWPEMKTAEAELHNQRRREDAIARLPVIQSEFDVIHGHFLPRKYQDLFPDAEITSFVRNPYQQSVSAYEHALRTTSSYHPGTKQLHDEKMSVIDFIERFPNIQSMYLNTIDMNDFAMLGLTEKYDESIGLFRARFALPLTAKAEPENVNPAQGGMAYEISDDVRSAVNLHFAEDLELYAKANENFARLLSRYNM